MKRQEITRWGTHH